MSHLRKQKVALKTMLYSNPPKQIKQRFLTLDFEDHPSSCQMERNRGGCSEGTALPSPLIREYIPLSTQWDGPASERTEDVVCFPFSARRRFHHPIILHLHVRSSVLLFMLIGIGCFGLWHRHLALAVNCSFLSHLAKELKPAIFWVRIRHLKKNVHMGKPLRRVEWKKGAGRGLESYKPHCGVTRFQRWERKMALWFPDTSRTKCSGVRSVSPSPSILHDRCCLHFGSLPSPSLLKTVSSVAHGQPL